MKTSIEMVQDVYSAINVGGVTGLLDGSIYLLSRPQNSQKRDIVIAVLGSQNTQLQKGIISVNVHCPNLTNVVIAGITDQMQPDVTNFGVISKACTNILNKFIGLDFQLFAQNTGVLMRDPADGTWYVNIRVTYYSFIDNFASN